MMLPVSESGTFTAFEFYFRVLNFRKRLLTSSVLRKNKTCQASRSKPFDMTEMFFVITGKPECTLSDHMDKAKDFSLAKLHGSFTDVKI